jgi:CheY-like chemotaxis protein
MPLVLLIEDHESSRKLMRDILSIRFDVAEAGRADEALGVLRERVVDLILMDMQLPGTDGLTLTRQLKSDPATQAIPIVAVSAHAMQQNIDDALASGCVAYVTKPLVDDPFVFVEWLSQWMPDVPRFASSASPSTPAATSHA